MMYNDESKAYWAIEAWHMGRLHVLEFFNERLNSDFHIKSARRQILKARTMALISEDRQGLQSYE
jgi:hypothetical protein